MKKTISVGELRKLISEEQAKTIPLGKWAMKVASIANDAALAFQESGQQDVAEYLYGVVQEMHKIRRANPAKNVNWDGSYE